MVCRRIVRAVPSQCKRATRGGDVRGGAAPEPPENALTGGNLSGGKKGAGARGHGCNSRPAGNLRLVRAADSRAASHDIPASEARPVARRRCRCSSDARWRMRIMVFDGPQKSDAVPLLTSSIFRDVVIGSALALRHERLPAGGIFHIFTIVWRLVKILLIVGLSYMPFKHKLVIFFI